MFKKPPLKNNRGFTLIELLVVMTIIGILSSVILISVNKTREDARDAQRLTEIRHFINTLEIYRLDNGTYPPSDTSSPGCTGPTCLAGLKKYLVDTGYTTAIPLDPKHGDSDLGYRYCRLNPAQGNYYSIIFRGGGTNWCMMRTSANIPAGINNCWMGPAGEPEHGWCEDEL